MNIEEFIQHAQEEHGFDFSGVGYPQPLDVVFHRHLHEKRQNEMNHSHTTLEVDWQV